MTSEKTTGTYFNKKIMLRLCFKRLKSTFICLFVCFLVKVVHKTLRYRVVGTDYLRDKKKTDPTVRYAIASWHQNVCLAITSLIGQKVCLMVSPSVDGDIIAWVAKRLKLSTVRGSSSRGGNPAGST